VDHLPRVPPPTTTSVGNLGPHLSHSRNKQVMAGRGRAGNQLPSTDTLTCQESGAARDGVTAPGGPAEAGASGSSREMELEGDTESEACEKRHQDRVPGVSKLVLNLCPVCLASYGNPVRGGC
jgi:hypothetical protein